MKITKYFVSSYQSKRNLKLLITEVESQRDDFITSNLGKIEEFETESIQFLENSTGENVAAIITLTYYIKENGS